FSPQYLLAGLAGSDPEYARLECAGPTKAALLTGIPDKNADEEAVDEQADTGHRDLVMPVRLASGPVRPPLPGRRPREVEDGQEEVDVPVARVGVGVGTVPGEHGRRALLHEVRAPVDAEGQRPLLHVDDLLGAGHVRVALPGLAGPQRPAPQLQGRPRVAPGQQRPRPAVTALAQHLVPVRRELPDRRLLLHLHQPRRRDAQRGRDADERAEVRVAAALLQPDEDALAHPGPSRQLVQAPAVTGPERPDGPRHGLPDRALLAHSSSSRRVRPRRPGPSRPPWSRAPRPVPRSGAPRLVTAARPVLP